jgi:hypothetical protein
MMNKLIFFVSLIFANASFANTQIASCQSPEGHSFYPFISPLKKDQSGWHKDKTTAGKTTLVKIGNEYDVLYTDATPRGIVSSKSDGATIVLLRKTSKDIAVLVAYQNVTQIYTFWQTSDGKYQYSEVSSKGGTISKSSAMVGTSDYENLN